MYVQYMPTLNIVKHFKKNAYYHVYNRGAGKQDIFFDNKDYWTFHRICRNLAKKHKVKITAFSLLENHYHLMCFQSDEKKITSFMRTAMTKYVIYINKKYNRSGRLFETIYKAIYMEDEDQLRRTTEYILKNPINAGYLNWPHVGTKI